MRVRRERRWLNAPYKPGGAAALSGLCLVWRGTWPRRGTGSGQPNILHKPEMQQLHRAYAVSGRAHVPSQVRICTLLMHARRAHAPHGARNPSNRRLVNRNLHRRNAAALQRAPRPHIMVDGTEVPVRSSGRGAKPHRRYSPRARMRADPVSIRAARASRRPIKGRRAGRAVCNSGADSVPDMCPVSLDERRAAVCLPSFHASEKHQGRFLYAPGFRRARDRRARAMPA